MPSDNKEETVGSKLKEREGNGKRRISRLFLWFIKPRHPIRHALETFVLLGSFIGMVFALWQTFADSSLENQLQENGENIVQLQHSGWSLSDPPEEPLQMFDRTGQGYPFFEGDAFRYQQANQRLLDECHSFDDLSRERKIMCESTARWLLSVAGVYKTMSVLVCQMVDDVDELAKLNHVDDWTTNKRTVLDRSNLLVEWLTQKHYQIITTREGLRNPKLPESYNSRALYPILFDHTQALQGGVVRALDLNKKNPTLNSESFHSRQNQIELMSKSITPELRRLCVPVLHGGN